MTTMVKRTELMKQIVKNIQRESKVWIHQVKSLAAFRHRSYNSLLQLSLHFVFIKQLYGTTVYLHYVYV